MSAVKKMTGSETPPAPVVSRGGLRRRALSFPDAALATAANIGPAFGVMFGFAAIVGVVGSPVSIPIVVGGIGIIFLGNTVAEFSKVIPSAGAFVTYAAKTFGARTGLTTALAMNVGYIIAAAGIYPVCGAFLSSTCQKYLGFHFAWQVGAAALVALTLGLNLRGVKPSTYFARICVVFEIGVLALVSVLTILQHLSSLSFAPLNPAKIPSVHGFGVGFALAILLYLGWESSASLAEETAEPRRNIPRAVFAGITGIIAIFVVASYAMVISFKSTTALAAAPIPFITEAQGVASFLVPLAYLAGITSIVGIFIAGTNAQSRLLFSAGREGLLPKVFGRTHKRWLTPWVALVTYFGLQLGIAYVFGWNTKPDVFFGEAATLGVILVVVMYMFANIILPFYFQRKQQDAFSPLRHVVAPLLGLAALAYPLWTLVQPGQPAPFDEYRWIALGVIVLSAVYALVVSKVIPDFARRVDAVIAEED